MATAPRRPCPRCGALVTSRCRACQRADDRARGSSTARGYGREWTATARAWLARHPTCGERADGRLHDEHSRCTQRGERVRATVVDHIDPLANGGARLDPRNLQSLCTACNTRKSINVDRARLARRGWPRLLGKGSSHG